MVRTRSEVHNNPTVIDLKQQARAKQNQEWLAFYETLRNAIVSGEVKDYFAGQTVEDDEERDMVMPAGIVNRFLPKRADGSVII